MLYKNDKLKRLAGTFYEGGILTNVEGPKKYMITTVKISLWDTGDNEQIMITQQPTDGQWRFCAWNRTDKGFKSVELDPSVYDDNIFKRMFKPNPEMKKPMFYPIYNPLDPTDKGTPRDYREGSPVGDDGGISLIYVGAPGSTTEATTAPGDLHRPSLEAVNLPANLQLPPISITNSMRFDMVVAIGSLDLKGQKLGGNKYRFNIPANLVHWENSEEGRWIGSLTLSVTAVKKWDKTVHVRSLYISYLCQQRAYNGWNLVTRVTMSPQVNMGGEIDTGWQFEGWTVKEDNPGATMTSKILPMDIEPEYYSTDDDKNANKGFPVYVETNMGRNIYNYTRTGMRSDNPYSEETGCDLRIFEK